jgi:hypothetical protein
VVGLQRPTTWGELKLAMRYKFVPSSYTRGMVRKLQNLSQGSDTVQEYFDALETTLVYAFIEESEDDFMDRFWNGLNPDIQDIFMHEEYYSITCMLRLACKAEQKIKRRAHETSKRTMTVNFPTSLTTVIAASFKFDESQPSVPTLTERYLKGYHIGTDFHPPHDNDECHADLPMSCDDFSNELTKPPIVEDRFVALKLSCDQ